MLSPRLVRISLAMGIIAVIPTGQGCGPCRDQAQVSIPKACPEGSSSTEMKCDPPVGYTGLRAELDYRRWSEWSRVAARHDVDPGPAPSEPSNPKLAELSTSTIVEELRREARTNARDRDQELLQACRAPDPIWQRTGGVAVLIDKGSFKLPNNGLAELPSRALAHGGAGDDVCLSDTAGDARELASTNGGTLFFIDRHHLVGAGHVLLSRICTKKTTDRLDDYVIAFGLTHDAITSDGTIKVPVGQIIDGSTVTVAECHGSGELHTEGDWVVLRTDECICGAEPLPVRWDAPVVERERVHALGHPNQLTMKYSTFSEVARSRPRVPVFEMDLVTDNGSSGSPIFDEDGAVVGIHNGSWKTSCSWHCEPEAGRCCRRARCKQDDCGLDGYATHIQRVRTAWEKSRETIDSKECESK